MYNTINKHIKSKNFVLMLGDHVVRVPVSPSFAPWLALGNAFNSVIFPHRNGADFGDFAVSLLDCWTSVASIGGVFSPAMEVALNRDYKGENIYRENNIYNSLPAWQKAYDSTPEVFVDLSRYINQALGGSDIEDASTRFNNPAGAYHIIMSWLGGPAEIVKNFVQLGKYISASDDIKASDLIKRIAIVNRFYGGDIDDYIARDIEDVYWETKDAVAWLSNSKSKAVLSKMQGNFANILKNNPMLKEFDQVVNEAKAQEKPLRSIYRRDKILSDPSLMEGLYLANEIATTYADYAKVAQKRIEQGVAPVDAAREVIDNIKVFAPSIKEKITRLIELKEQYGNN